MGGVHKEGGGSGGGGDGCRDDDSEEEGGTGTGVWRARSSRARFPAMMDCTQQKPEKARR